MAALSKSDTYKTWRWMKARCYVKTNSAYPKYGGKGIKMCKRWLKFENFLADMGERPAGMSIDRKDNAKGYSKSNCRWATGTQQALNRSVTRWIEHNGDKLCLSEWARRIGLKRHHLWIRLYKLGWSVERAVTTPSRGQ